MAEDVVETILKEDKSSRIKLIEQQIEVLSTNELTTCLESFSLYDFAYAKDSVLVNLSEQMINKIAPLLLEILNNLLIRDGITTLLEHKDELLKSNSFYSLINDCGTNLHKIAQMLKSGIDPNDILSGITTKFDDSEIEALNEEDRSIVMEKFYLYFPNEIVKKFVPEKRSYEIDNERKSFIDKTFHELLEASNDNTIIECKLETGFFNVFTNMGDMDKLDLIKTYEYALGADIILKLAQNMSDENKIELIKHMNSSLDMEHLGEILSGIKTYSQEITKYVSMFLEHKSFCVENIEFSFRILSGLGVNVFNNPKNANLLSDKSIKLLGEENIYQLFKYFVATGDTIEIENILKEPEIFNKYIEYRKNIFKETPIGIMNLKDAIFEFNNNFELIQEVMNSSAEITPEQENLFRAVLTEPKVKIDKMDELKNFPQKREEIINTLIKENSEEALVYLLTGLSYDEYKEKVKFFINDEQITKTMNEVNEENTDFAIIKAINEFIEFIEGMEEDKKKRVLKEYNTELAQEFTPKGSSLAKNRSIFSDIETKIRKIYGQELSSALKTKELPMPQKDDEDKEISIIQLKGEEFKLLIHGIDGVGSGSGRFEKHDRGSAHICTSLISNKHVQRVGAACYYGFDDIESNAMILEGTSNIFSSGKGAKVSANSDVQFRLSDKLIEESKGWNEIVLWREYQGDNGEKREVWPNYVVCFGAIDRKARIEAKRLGIPIVLIDEKSYEKNASEKVPEVFEEEDKEIPESYEETKVSMINILRNAAHESSALAQQDAMSAIVNQMEKDLTQDKAMVH